MGSLSGWLMLFGMMARPLAISYKLRGDVVLGVLAQNYFLGVGIGFGFVIIIRWFSGMNIFHFRWNCFIIQLRDISSFLARIGLCRFKHKSFSFTSFKRSFPYSDIG
jgi:hypothetical protein